jgi:cytosine/adenosine deaminase-related metal-dependent hydrolase
MTTLLVKHADILVTMDGLRQEISDGGLFIRDGFIEQVGPTSELPQDADQILNLTGHLILPGLVNTHHHFYQTLTRAVPAAQDANLFGWLTTLYPIWAGLTPDDIYLSTQTALAELALTGCTTASDHLYIYPNGSRLDDEIHAALEIGVRLQASRGSMSLGESQGGLPPDGVVEDENAILKESLRLIQTYHDPNPGAMTQTETEDEDQFCLDKFGYKPVAYMESVDWIGEDVWFAHSVHVNQDEIDLYARTGCGVAHCPTSNMRLASGIAPIVQMLTAGVKVGLGVDGSASNDGSHMLAEARMAMLLSRVGAGEAGFSLSSEGLPPLMTARTALELATRGGAAVLGRTDIGSLEAGKCADFFALDLRQLEFAGGLHDPVAAAVFCAPVKASYTVVGGKVVVSEGHLTTIDLPALIEKHNAAAQRLAA